MPECCSLGRDVFDVLATEGKMSHGIVIIGPGFAARQLVKNIRKQDANVR